MIVASIVLGYAALLALLTFGGTAACKLVLQWSATKAPPESGEKITLRAGRIIGILERLLIFVGLVATQLRNPGRRSRFEDGRAVTTRRLLT
jgi:hypothetical protein